MHHRSDDLHSDGRKQSRRRPERAAIPRQKTPLGGLAATFSSLAGRKRDHGASRDAPEPRKRPEKERRSAKSGRKAADGAPNAMLDPCNEAPWRCFLPSCEQNRATAASRKEKPAKRYNHLAGFRPWHIEPVKRSQHLPCYAPSTFIGLEGNREHSQPSLTNSSSSIPQNTAPTWHYGFFIKPQSPCWTTPFPLTMGTWGDQMVAVQGDRPMHASWPPNNKKGEKCPDSFTAEQAEPRSRRGSIVARF